MPADHLNRWTWEHPGWPGFHWDAAALAPRLAAARRAQGQTLGAARLLDADLDTRAQLEVLVDEGLATSALEGESVDPHALRSSLARRLGLPGAGLPARARAVEGLVDVLLDATHDYDAPLELPRLCAWQAALFPTGRSGLVPIRVGELRGEAPMQIVSGPIGNTRVHYEAPPRERLETEVRQFLAWFNAPPIGLDGLLRAGLAHGWFELIHPFEDGNGRVGRALLDRALAQDERRARRLYGLSERLMSVRADYYAALETLSVGDLDVTSWLGWFLEQLTAAAKASERVVDHVLRKARFWMRNGSQALNDRQRKALNALLDAGDEGFTGGLTNRKYAHLTDASPATAQRDLADLTARGLLVVSGAGRSVRYALAARAE